MRPPLIINFSYIETSAANVALTCYSSFVHKRPCSEKHELAVHNSPLQFQAKVKSGPNFGAVDYFYMTLECNGVMKFKVTPRFPNRLVQVVGGDLQAKLALEVEE